MLKELMPIMIENFKICLIENAPTLAEIAGYFTGVFVLCLIYLAIKIISKRIYRAWKQL